jgi:hypothetical protein
MGMMTQSAEHRQRMERRAYLLRKRSPRYHVTLVRRDQLQTGEVVDNLICGGRSNDLDGLVAIADSKAPAYVIDNWARPTPEVVYVALPPDKIKTKSDPHMTRY